MVALFGKVLETLRGGTYMEEVYHEGCVLKVTYKPRSTAPSLIPVHLAVTCFLPQAQNPQSKDWTEAIRQPELSHSTMPYTQHHIHNLLIAPPWLLPLQNNWLLPLTLLFCICLLFIVVYHGGTYSSI